jgi:MraZ protein
VQKAYGRQGSQGHFVPPFVSTFTNKLDAKGRVSIPAPYRQILAQQEMGALYCIPSFVSPSLEAFGNTLLNQFQQRLDKYDPLFSENYDDEAHVVLAAAQSLNLDDEGRVRLPDDLIAHAGITERVVFVGLGQKFQMWDPVRFEPVQRERIQRARALRNGGNGGAA